MITLAIILLAIILVAAVIAAIATVIGVIALPLLDIVVGILVIGGLIKFLGWISGSKKDKKDES